MNISASVLQNNALVSFSFGPCRKNHILQMMDERQKKASGQRRALGVSKVQRKTSRLCLCWSLVLNLLGTSGKSNEFQLLQ